MSCVYWEREKHQDIQLCRAIHWRVTLWTNKYIVTQDSRGKFWDRLASSSVRNFSITAANLVFHFSTSAPSSVVKQQHSRNFASSVVPFSNLMPLLLTWGCLGWSGFVLFLLNYCHHKRKRQICCCMCQRWWWGAIITARGGVVGSISSGWGSGEVMLPLVCLLPPS